MSYILKVKGKY